MHLQVLGSGSEGNALVVRADDLVLMVDAGLGVRVLSERLETARVGIRAVDHLLITHAHLDHSRSGGALAKRQRAVLHAAEANLQNRSLARAPEKVALRVGRERLVQPASGSGELGYTPVLLPHDCDPTVAYRLRHGERVACVLTDLGRPCTEVARALSGAHLLVLEFNYDPGMMARGPYPETLRRRITGGRGHLSNEQGAEMLEHLAGPELHTVVLAHISAKNNTPDLALAAARGALERLGRPDVRLLVAEQHAVGENLEV